MWMKFRHPVLQFASKRVVCDASTSSGTANTIVGDDHSQSKYKVDRDDPWWMGRKLWRLNEHTPFQCIPQAWVSRLDAVEEQNVGIIDMHPDVFRVTPRLDILHRNVTWQDNYRSVSFVKSLHRAEMPGGGRKPWPQNKVGKARAGSLRAPNFKNGGISHGVRGPETKFYMLPTSLRVAGLTTALTLKHVQNDLVIVDSLEDIPDEGSDQQLAQFLHDVAEHRNWGYSVLFVDVADVAPRNLAMACSEIPSFNIIPYYGLNCYSMIKYETIVMSVDALHLIERRLLEALHQPKHTRFQYKHWKAQLLREGVHDDDQGHFVPVGN